MSGDTQNCSLGCGPPRGTWKRSALEAALADKQLRPAYVVRETADNLITRSLVLRSDLVTAASPHLFQEEIASGSLSVTPCALKNASCASASSRRCGRAVFAETR